MATDKPRFSVTFSEDVFNKIQKYREENHISTKSKAVAQLVALAVEDLERSGGKEQPPPYSGEALQMAHDFDRELDGPGRRAVRAVADIEIERAKDETRVFEDPDPEPKVIPLYLFPAAAGYAAPVMNEDYELYELGPEDPPGAVFAVRLQGDSMEPDFPDGSVVFCDRDPLADGDIGIFCVDGGTVCKQYHKEGGAVYLFSLNRARSGADVALPPGSGRSIVCQGRVMTRRRYPVPGRG